MVISIKIELSDEILKRARPSYHLYMDKIHCKCCCFVLNKLGFVDLADDESSSIVSVFLSFWIWYIHHLKTLIGWIHATGCDASIAYFFLIFFFFFFFSLVIMRIYLHANLFVNKKTKIVYGKWTFLASQWRTNDVNHRLRTKPKRKERKEIE